MGLSAGLYDLMACKASALSTMERENKDRLPLTALEVPGVWEEERGRGEGLWGGAANSDEANRQDFQANDR